jgi:ssDNA-binding Zn-finger/Zn-ribbon topoisomerase 1
VGAFICIAGTHPCPQCSKPLDGWQSKQLIYDGYPIEASMQTYELKDKMSGRMQTVCPSCGFVTVIIDRGELRKSKAQKQAE